MNALPDLPLSAFDIKAAWDVETLQNDKTWVQTLSDEHHQELRLALAQFRKKVSAENIWKPG